MCTTVPKVRDRQEGFISLPAVEVFPGQYKAILISSCKSALVVFWLKESL